MLFKTPRFPWYILLLPVFFVLHTVNGYFALISIPAAARYLAYYLLLAFLLYWLQRAIFKNHLKAGIFTQLLLILFFFWGASHDFLKTWGLPAFFVSYSFLLPAILLLLMITGLLLYRTKQNLWMIHRFFQVTMAVILLLEAGIFLYNVVSHTERRNNPGYSHQHPAIHAQAAEKPDIFYITLDEYTSTKALQEFLHFDNRPLDSLLIKNNFYVAANSRSNYNSTPYSVGSTFQMNYYDQDLEGKSLTAKNMLEACYSFRENPVCKFFAGQGYGLYNYGIINLQQQPVAAREYFGDYQDKILSGETFWGRAKKEILWNLFVRLPGFNKDAVPEDNYSLNKENFSSFFTELKKESNAPRFVIGHLMMPHRPFHFDRNGRQRTLSRNDYKDAVHDSLYIDQLIYTNSLIDSMARTANRVHTRPLVLVIAGDHGNRYSQQGLRSRDKQFMNLNAFYFSDGDYRLLYDSISPVNSFRVILNKYFKTGLPLLKDSTVRFRD